MCSFARCSRFIGRMPPSRHASARPSDVEASRVYLGVLAPICVDCALGFRALPPKHRQLGFEFAL
eukprot:11338655-Alexandrium_andersonii.AAC.1